MEGGGGREVQEGGDICIHIADSLHCTEETNTTLQSNYTPIIKKKRINSTEREPSYTVGENVSWCSHYGNSMEFPQKTENRAANNPTISLLGIYPDKTIIQKDTCTPLFIAALFTIAKTWKQPKCPSTDEWIKKMWSIYTMEYYSAIKKNEIMPLAATWMQLEIIILSEVSQKEKDKYHMISLTCGI